MCVCSQFSVFPLVFLPHIFTLTVCQVQGIHQTATLSVPSETFHRVQKLLPKMYSLSLSPAPYVHTLLSIKCPCSLPYSSWMLLFLKNSIPLTNFSLFFVIRLFLPRSIVCKPWKIRCTIAQNHCWETYPTTEGDFLFYEYFVGLVTKKNWYFSMFLK